MRFVALSSAAVSIAAFVVIGFRVSQWYGPAQGGFGGQYSDSLNPAWFVVPAQAVLMIIGIAFSHLYTRLSALRSAGQERVAIAREFKRMFSATSFWLALAASPLVFAGILMTGDEMTVPVQLFIAFQNGFFWHTVMPKEPVPAR